MPITQQRVMNLIDAAIDYKDAFEQLTLDIKRTFDLIEQNNYNLESIKSLIIDLLLHVDAPDHYLKNPLQSQITLRLEHDHFHRHFKSNISSARRMQRKRNSNPTPPLSTTLTRFNLSSPPASPTPSTSQPVHLQPQVQAQVQIQSSRCSTCQYPGNPEYCGMPEEATGLDCPYGKNRVSQEILIMYFKEDFKGHKLPLMLTMDFPNDPGPPRASSMP